MRMYQDWLVKMMKDSFGARIRLLAVLGAVATTGAFGQDRRVLVSTDGTLTAIDDYVSVDDAGNVAFTGTDNGASKAFVVTLDSEEQNPITFSANNRFFLGAAIHLPADSSATPLVATRDRVTGNPPLFFMRAWQGDGSLDYTLIGRSPDDFDSCQAFVDINANAIVAFPALVDNSMSTALMAGSAQPPITLATYPGVVLLRPQISDTNRIVIRDPQNRIVVWPYPSGMPQTVADSTSGFVTVGQEPGISADGLIVTFAGNRGNGTEVLAGIRFEDAWSLVSLARDAGEPFDSINIDQRIGVVSSGSLQHPSGFRAAVVFVATHPDRGVPGVYAVGLRLRIVDSMLESVVGLPVEIAYVGQQLGSHEFASFRVYDPLNQDRAIAFKANLANGSAIVEVSPCARKSEDQPLTPKFKQFAGGWQSSCLISNYSTCNATGCPPGVGTFLSGGCTIASFATGAALLLARHSISSQGVTPLSVQQFLRQKKIQSCRNGRIPLEAAFFERRYPNDFAATVSCDTPPAGSHFTLADAVERLKDGFPVILFVPSAKPGSNKAAQRALLLSGTGHYVVAYDYDQSLGLLFGDAAGILINDPGWGTSVYGQDNLAGHVPGFNGSTLDQNVHVTLHDYFAGASRRSALEIDYFGCWGEDPVRDNDRIREFYDEGRVYWQEGGSDGLTSSPERVRPMRYTLAIELLRPGVVVNSPVEVALTDPETGVRYVSSQGIANPGDVLLERFAEAAVDPPQENEPPIEFDPMFPPYTLMLPQDLYGRDLDVEVIGIGNGEFSVSYCHRGTDFQAPDPIVGTIRTGQIIHSQFNLHSVCLASLDGDEFVNLNDLEVLVSCLGVSVATCGDIDADGDTDLQDLAIFQIRFGETCR